VGATGVFGMDPLEPPNLNEDPENFDGYTTWEDLLSYATTEKKEKKVVKNQ
jgi:hypothetical protein